MEEGTEADRPRSLFLFGGYRFAAEKLDGYRIAIH